MRVVIATTGKCLTLQTYKMRTNILFITLHSEQDIGEQWNINNIPKLCILAFRNGCVYLVIISEQFSI